MWLIEDQNTEEIIGEQGIFIRWKKYVEELYETCDRPGILATENAADVSEDKNKSILKEEIELALKEIKNGKAIGFDGIPIELVNCLSEGKKETLCFATIYSDSRNMFRFII